MYLGYVALSVFFRVCTSVNLLRMRYVLRFRRHYETSPKKKKKKKGEREKARGKNNDLSHVPSKRNEEIKSGTSGCGSFVVPYFQPATSTTDRLHIYCASSRMSSPQNKKKLKLFLYSKLQITQISMIIDQSHYCR